MISSYGNTSIGRGATASVSLPAPTVTTGAAPP